MAETFDVDNEGFLRTIFGDADYQDAHVCGFPEDPGAPGDNGRWAGTRWGSLGPEQRAALTGMNAYFCVSLFELDTDGVPRRRKSLFSSYHVVVVDDVGTKVQPATALRAGKPTYKLETSPGNYQWGFLLREPELDADRVDGALRMLLSEGLTVGGRDPGMVGVTRYARLPVGVNTKAAYGGEWKCALTKWAP